MKLMASGDALGGHGEVAFIFAVFVVDHHQHPPGAHLLRASGMVARASLVIG
jgi:hypothetical protein